MALEHLPTFFSIVLSCTWTRVMTRCVSESWLSTPSGFACWILSCMPPKSIIFSWSGLMVSSMSAASALAWARGLLLLAISALSALILFRSAALACTAAFFFSSGSCEESSFSCCSIALASISSLVSCTWAVSTTSSHSAFSSRREARLWRASLSSFETASSCCRSFCTAALLSVGPEEALPRIPPFIFREPPPLRRPLCSMTWPSMVTTRKRCLPKAILLAEGKSLASSVSRTTE
mmetsp:Transcript_22620/g.89490  ORF Transcript_22620/g.89490 Transcript_22620/m.89490 type:complete len:236 (-) Transcript_22620:440-1147(-)